MRREAWGIEQYKQLRYTVKHLAHYEYHIQYSVNVMVKYIKSLLRQQQIFESKEKNERSTFNVMQAMVVCIFIQMRWSCFALWTDCLLTTNYYYHRIAAIGWWFVNCCHFILFSFHWHFFIPSSHPFPGNNRYK